MNKFNLGDRVRIITNEYGEAGKLFVIDEIEGSDDVAHETPYCNRGGYWYKADDLIMAQPAYAKEYAIGAPSTAQPAADAGGVVPSAFAQAVQGDDRLAVALYEAAVLNTVVADLQAQLAALQVELADATKRGTRILNLRRALKEIEKTSGDGNSVMDAKEALERDALHTKQDSEQEGE